MRIHVRPFQEHDEAGWVRCRVLAFLDSAYYDNVITEKERYENPSVELVAEIDGIIVGLLDVEYEREAGSVTYQLDTDPREGPGAVIHHLAVHPDYRRRGIGKELLARAIDELRQHSVRFLEAWTRDDEGTCRWYESQGFRSVTSYLHVYLEGTAETKESIASNIPKLVVVHAFAHYLGDEPEAVRQRFQRVHTCQLYRRAI